MSETQLSRETALAWVGQHEWKKGQDYVRGLTGLSRQPEGQGTAYRANAHGQEKYAVQATVQDGQIVAARCACPVGGGGDCKHVAALLARIVGSSADFEALPSVDEVLNQLNEAGLRETIRLMLRAEPTLLRLLLTRPRPAPDGSTHLLRRVQDAFSLIDYDPEEDWEGEGPDLSDLDPLLEEMRQLSARREQLSEAALNDLADAAIECMDGLLGLYDDEYGVEPTDYMAPIRTVLLALLGMPMHEALRENLRDSLQESILEAGWSASEVSAEGQAELVALLPAAERADLMHFLAGSSEQVSSYRERGLAAVRLELSQGEALDFAEELALARQTGEVRSEVAVLLRHGRPASEVSQTLREAPRKAAPQEVEDLLAAHDLLPQLEDYARQHLKVYGARAWLYGRYRQTGRQAEAHALAREAVLKGTGDHAFYTSRFLPQDLKWVAELKAISPDWPADRAEYIRKIWKSAALTDSLLGFLLDEGLLPEAQQLVTERKEANPELVTRLALRLPADQAKPLLLRAATLHVAGGNRTHYAQAAATLKEGSALIGQEEARAMARLLLQNNPRLRALPEELKKVGLA